MLAEIRDQYTSFCVSAKDSEYMLQKRSSTLKIATLYTLNKCYGKQSEEYTVI